MDKSELNSLEKEYNKLKRSKYILIVFCILFCIMMFIIPFVDEHERGDFTMPIIASIGIPILGLFLYNREKSKYETLIRKKQIESDYKEAIKGSDKVEALKLGREYYASLREDGRVTIYDEQAITNDINSMANTVNVVNTVIYKIEKEEFKSNSSVSNQKTLYCSKCGIAYVPNVNKLFCEACGNKY